MNNEYNYNASEQNLNGDNEQYSSHHTYQQNYYGYSNGTASPNGNGEPPKKKSVSTAVIILAIVAATVVISLLLVTLSSIYSNSHNYGSDKGVDMNGETLTVVQNSPSIDLTQNTDVDYVPLSIPEVVQKIGTVLLK